MAKPWENIALGSAARPLVPMRLYDGAALGDAKSGTKSKAPPLVLYLRGGAFLEDDISECERPTGKALSDAGAVVLEADYRGVSQNLFPQAMEYAFQALDCLSRKRKHFGSGKSLLLIAGDEAGGNVAAGVALKARDQMPGQLDGQILMSPMIDPMMSSVSFRRADAIGMRERWSDGWSHYLQAACGFQHPYAAPCLCSRLNGLAPAMVVTSEDDPLQDEALNYAERLEASGVTVRRKVLPADSGWIGIYGDGGGRWQDAFATEFAGFVRQLSA